MPHMLCFGSRWRGCNRRGTTRKINRRVENKNPNMGWVACRDSESPSFAEALDATLTLAKESVIHDWLWTSV